MKFLLFLILIVLVSFMMGVKRGVRPPEGRTPPPPQPPQPKNIVHCAQCGLLLPQDEVLPGRGGVFCGAAHRAAYEAAHGPDGLT